MSGLEEFIGKSAGKADPFADFAKRIRNALDAEGFEDKAKTRKLLIKSRSKMWQAIICSDGKDIEGTWFNCYGALKHLWRCSIVPSYPKGMPTDKSKSLKDFWAQHVKGCKPPQGKDSAWVQSRHFELTTTYKSGDVFVHRAVERELLVVALVKLTARLWKEKKEKGEAKKKPGKKVAAEPTDISDENTKMAASLLSNDAEVRALKKKLRLAEEKNQQTERALQQEKSAHALTKKAAEEKIQQTALDLTKAGQQIRDLEYSVGKISGELREAKKDKERGWKIVRFFKGSRERNVGEVMDEYNAQN